MSQEFAHPTEKYDTSHYSENMTAQEARLLVLKGYSRNAFVCNGDNKTGIGKCQCPILLAAVDGKVPPYFKSVPNSQHTCNIEKQEVDRANANRQQENQYQTESVELAFFREAFMTSESTQKTVSSANAHAQSSTKKYRTVSASTTNIQNRREKIKTLRAVVSNRLTVQYLDNGRRVKLDDLFFPIVHSKQDVDLPDSRLMLIWEASVQIFAYVQENGNGDQYIMYSVFAPHQTIEGRSISLYLNENQMKELLPNWERYLSQSKKQSSNPKRHILHLYTTIVPTTSVDNKYENIIPTDDVTHINHEIYLKP